VKAFKKYFITGLLIWIPLVITVWVVSAIIGAMDQSLFLLPEIIHPDKLLGVHIPGVGTVLTLLVIFLTGLVTAEVTLESVLLAFGVSTAIGIVFGWYPARRASNLNPIDALRYE